MAFTPTLLDSGSDTNASALTALSTAAVSPVEGREHFLALLVSDGNAVEPTTPAVVGCGLTWAEEEAFDFADVTGTSTKRLVLMRGTGTVSGTPDTLDMTWGDAPNGVAWAVFDGEGLDGTTPIVQAVTDASDVGVATLTVGNLTDFSDTPSDGTMLLFAKLQNDIVTLEGGWNLLAHEGFDTPAASFTVAYRADPDLQSVLNWTGNAKCGGIIIRMGSVADAPSQTQQTAALAEINRLLSRAGRIAVRLGARRREGTDISTDLAALRAILSDLYAKHDEILVESLDIDDLITQLGTDRDTLLSGIGDPGDPPPTPVALLKGLMTRENESSNVEIEHYNPNITWASLQPTRLGPIDEDVIGDLIAAGDSFRARIFVGPDAPSWLKSEVGTVSTYTAQDLSIPPQNVVRYWEPAVLTYYEDFMTKLAALYDGVIPLIFEAMCMAVYAEPCLKQFNNATNRSVWAAAGYTNAKDLTAFNAALDIMASVWHQTRVGIAYNGYQLLSSSGGVSTSLAQTRALMERHRQLFGERAVIQNNSIRSSYIANPGALYDHMLEMGPPLSFQTARPSAVGDLPATVQWAVDMGAHAVELPNSFTGLITQTELEDLNALLRANP